MTGTLKVDTIESYTASAQNTFTRGVVINESGADSDTRIEGDTNPNLFFIDASTDRVGIGTNTPTKLLEVSGSNPNLRVVATTGDCSVILTSAAPKTYDLSVSSTGFSINNSGILSILSHTQGTNLMFMPPVYNNTSGVSANMYVAANGELIRATSSLRYKKDVTNVEIDALEKVMNLRPVYYYDKKDEENKTRFMGFIAEEVAVLGLTELVQFNEEGLADALNYDKFTSLLVKAIQEQQAQIEQLKADIATLRGE
jgi:hypothetical protein